MKAGEIIVVILLFVLVYLGGLAAGIHHGSTLTEAVYQEELAELEREVETMERWMNVCEGLGSVRSGRAGWQIVYMHCPAWPLPAVFFEEGPAAVTEN